MTHVGAFRNLIDPIQLSEEQIRPFVEAQVNGGMISTIDPADIPTSAFSVAKNGRFRYDKCIRAPGNPLYGPTKPNAHKVMDIFGFKKHDATTHIIRISRDTIHELAGASWNVYAGVLTGTDNDFFSSIFAFDACYLANGVDYIQVLNTGAMTFARLGNAPRMKYIAPFFNRIVGANYTEPASENPELLAWSGDLNLTEWNPLTDISAGSGPLVESPSDTSDDITGLIGGPNVLIIPRERTIWLATKNPTAQNPFNAFTAVTKHGTDCPYSITRTVYGLAFIDYRTKKVYVYAPNPAGGAIDAAQIISSAVQAEIFRSIDTPASVVGSYDTQNDEYSIVIPQLSSKVSKIWTFNFISKTWAYDEKENIKGIFDVDATAGVVTIGDLPGTIGALTGTIGSLNRSAVSSPIRVYTSDAGEIASESFSVDTQYNGSVITTVLESKRYSIPTNDIYVVRLRFEFNFNRATTLRLYWSKDAKKTWNLAKTFNVSEASDAKALYFNKQIKARKFEWKLEIDSGDFELIGYEIHVHDSSVSSK